MKKFLTILCILAVITSCKSGGAFSPVKGNKNITTIEESMPSFSEISVTGSNDIIFEQKAGQSPSVRIEIDENLKQYVRAEVKNGVLSISLDGQNIQPSQFKAYASSEALSRVRIAGSGDIILKGNITSPSLDISIAGSGSLYADDIQYDNLNISIAGSGGVKVAGSATNNNISIKGSGSVDAIDLNTRNTSCTISGSGSVKVYATEKLASKINGSGSILYKGDPQTHDKSINGSGSVSKL